MAFGLAAVIEHLMALAGRNSHYADAHVPTLLKTPWLHIST